MTTYKAEAFDILREYLPEPLAKSCFEKLDDAGCLDEGDNDWCMACAGYVTKHTCQES